MKKSRIVKKENKKTKIIEGILHKRVQGMLIIRREAMNNWSKIKINSFKNYQILGKKMKIKDSMRKNLNFNKENSRCYQCLQQNKG